MLKELGPIAAKLNEARMMLTRTLDQLTEEQVTQLMINPEWSVKDAIAHLIGAERGMTRMAQRFASGENPQLPDDYNNDVYNARQVAKRKAMSLVQVRAELETSRAELLVFMESLTADKLTLPGEHPLLGDTTVNAVLNVIASHEASHGNEISAKIHELKR